MNSINYMDTSNLELSQIDVIIQEIRTTMDDETQMQSFYEHLKQFQDIQKEDVTKNTMMQNIEEEFLSNNTFFFNKTSKIYYHYINNDYVLLNEDNMLYHVLDYITHYKEYRNSIDVSLKGMIKNKIIKSIKENNIYETIPDGDTIQKILNTLYPHIFSKKEYCKIFLIVIGNIVLKQLNQQRIILFTRSQMKPFLSELNKYISMYFCNNNLYNYFKFKFTQDHISLEKWKIPCNVIHYDMIHFNKQFYINLICVSIYYANRYQSIDGYLNNVVGDIEQVDSCVHFFKKHSKESIIEQYMKKYILIKREEHLTEKDLLFLWKKYIQEEDLFVHVFTSQSDFVNSIFKFVGQSCSNGKLLGYYSMELPMIDSFRHFWDTYFESCDHEYYFEISEILHLFHQKQKQKKDHVGESTIILILQSYYSDIHILGNKVIHNLKCSLWDKKKEIRDFIKKENIVLKENIHSLYKKYSDYQKNLKISKKYFSMYVEQLRNSNPSITS